MSFIGNHNGLNDSKSFRQRILDLAATRLGVIVKTLDEGNGSQTDKTSGLLGLLDSNYKSDVPSTKYAMHLKAIAFESARFLCSSAEYNNDQFFKYTQGEYLYQNIGSFLFPGEKIPQTQESDVSVRNFYLSIIKAYFGGATKSNIEESLLTFTGIPVTLQENFELSKTNDSLDSVVNQFLFNVNVDTSDPRITDVNSLKSNIKFLLDMIKPAHTTYQTNFIYTEEFLSENNLIEEPRVDLYDYKYEDLRKKDTQRYSFKVDGEVVQAKLEENSVFQASPRVVKTRDLQVLKDYDPAIFHTRHGPLGTLEGNLASVSDIVVKVNGSEVVVLEIFPLSGAFKLNFVPGPDDEITVSYYFLMKFTGELITNNFDSLLNNQGNSGEFPYKTTLFPSNYSVKSEANQLLTSYKYKGFDLFNTSVLNDPLNLNYNENGTRNKLNDAHVFKSLGYDFDEYKTTLQEDSSIFPMSLSKKDVWRRLPYQEIRLNDNEYILNNTEDRMFGEIHEISYHPFYSALEVTSKDNGGLLGIVSSIFEDPTSPMELSLSPFVEIDKLDLGHDGKLSFCTYNPSGYYSDISVLNNTSYVITGVANWVFESSNEYTGHICGDFGSFHLMLNSVMSETVTSLRQEWSDDNSVSGYLWYRDPNENSLFSSYIPASGSDFNRPDRGYLFNVVPKDYSSINPLSMETVSPIHIDDIKYEFYKNEPFISNHSLSNSLLQTIRATTKLSESDIATTLTLRENLSPYTLNDQTVLEEVFSISSDIDSEWIKLLAPKKISMFSSVKCGPTDYLDLGVFGVDSFIVNNQAILIRKTPFNASIFDPGKTILAEICMFDTMNESDILVSVFDSSNYIFYSDVDLTSVVSLINYSNSFSGQEYDLTNHYILGNSLICLDKSKQTIPLSKGDIVFAEIITEMEESNPANTMNYARNTKIVKFIEISPV